MAIQIQKTPNPNALKFVLPVAKFARPLNASTAEEAAHHPLAQALLALEPIYNVFLVQDFVTVNKLPHVPWEGLEEQVRQVIETYWDDGMMG